MTSTTGSLFDDDPAPGLSVVQVLARSKPESKAQSTFSRLVGEIERKRDQLTQWQAYAERYNKRLISEMEPLRAQVRAGQRQMILLIDGLLERRGRGQRLASGQRAKLVDLLAQLLEEVLEAGPDEVLEAVREKHSGVSTEEFRRAEMEMAEAMLKDVFDLDVDEEHGASTADELFQHAQRKLQERLHDEAQQAQIDRSARRSGASAAKAAAMQARREQAAKEIGQSLREVHRKLASALHPDREPDPAERARKTVLMQRVNRAYEANDLLALLSLQLEIEQIDAGHLSSLTPQRLSHYNQILREQLAGIDAELERFVQPFRGAIDWPNGRALSSAIVDQHLSADLVRLRGVLKALQADLIAFKDPARLREILRHYTLRREDEDPEDLAELLAMLEHGARPGRPGRRRKGR
jgi:hypothetical protein